MSLHLTSVYVSQDTQNKILSVSPTHHFIVTSFAKPAKQHHQLVHLAILQTIEPLIQTHVHALLGINQHQIHRLVVKYVVMELFIIFNVMMVIHKMEMVVLLHVKYRMDLIVRMEHNQVNVFMTVNTFWSF